MATGIDISAITLNLKEETDLQNFILERLFDRPELRRLHGVETGIKVNTQIVLASRMGMTGIKGDGTCDRKSSGAQSVLSEKVWTPAGIEDTISHCNVELNGLFKEYFDKINSYIEKYEIEGTDLEVFIATLFEETIYPTILRASWFGDTNVAAADAGTAGLIDAGNVQFFNYFNGLWEQIFTAVGTSDIARYEIAKNSEATKAAQIALASGEADTIMQKVYDQADSRLRSSPDKQFYVTRHIFDEYKSWLKSKGIAFTIEYTVDGLPEIRWDGIPVINMEIIWGENMKLFTDNTTNNAYYLPNRCVLTTPDNIKIGTINENDFTSIESWYNRDERKYKMSYGLGLDAKLIEEYMISVAY